MSDFDIEEYMERFVVLMMTKDVRTWPSNRDMSSSGLSEVQRRSLACTAGYMIYEQFNTKRTASITIKIADNGDISIS